MGKLCLVFLGVLLLSIAGVIGCSDSSTGSSGSSDYAGPERPSKPYPDNNADNQPASLTLCWNCTHNEGATMMYNVYFGTDTKPPLVAESLTVSHYDPGVLELAKTYYWKVVAFDSVGNSRNSRTWQFGTSRYFVYPLAVGNTWSYAGGFYCIKGSDPPDEMPWDSVGQDNLVEIAALETLPNAVEAYRFAVTIYESNIDTDYNDTLYLNEYLNNTADGLFSYAYSGIGFTAAPAKRKVGDYLIFKNRRFENEQELMAFARELVNQASKTGADEITIENPPLKSLSYPLLVGRQWWYRENAPWPMRKAVTRTTYRDVPAGRFWCWELQMLYDIDDDGDWDDDIIYYEYISPIGLIERSVTFTGIEYTDVLGDHLGTFDSKHRFVLTSFHLE